MDNFGSTLMVFGVISVVLSFFHEVNVQNGDGMPDILDTLFPVNSRCRVNAY